MIKNTPLHSLHQQLGAKMVPFAGYEMPISYTSIAEEHLAVRQAAGMFDVSHMGEFIIRGEGALAFVQHISSNDAARLQSGKVQYACLLNEHGGIIDDMLVYCLPDGAYMLVVNASNIEKDWLWIQQNRNSNVEIIDISEQTALIAVQGAAVATFLQTLTDMQLADMPYYTCQKGTFAGCSNVLVSSTGYTGAGGFEIYCYNEDAVSIWQAITEAGRSYGLLPVGLGARDTLRLEMGYCLYGNDIDLTTTPLEAGLSWVTKLNKNTDFIGKHALIEQKNAGLTRRLVGLELIDKGVPRHGYPICNAAGEVIGSVTSGTVSPLTKKALGLGYVPIEYATVGSEIFVHIREKLIAARVADTPFIAPSGNAAKK